MDSQERLTHIKNWHETEKTRRYDIDGYKYYYDKTGKFIEIPPIKIDGTNQCAAWIEENRPKATPKPVPFWHPDFKVTRFEPEERFRGYVIRKKWTPTLPSNYKPTASDSNH